MNRLALPLGPALLSAPPAAMQTHRPAGEPPVGLGAHIARQSLS